ncbi:MAG: substrate-binding domain-containing protein [Haliscomenobacter sp.]
MAQGAVITNFGEKAEPERSRRFFAYLFSDEARQIFMRYGYRLP